MFFLVPVFAEVGISGLQTFNISEKGSAIKGQESKAKKGQHLFLCDHYQKCISSAVFIKENSTTYALLDVF